MREENLDDIKDELDELKKQAYIFQTKIYELERKINKSSESEKISKENLVSPAETSFRNFEDRSNLEKEPKQNIEKIVPSEAAYILSQMQHQSIPDVPKKESPQIQEKAKKLTNMESNFGRFWLNKIGILVFTLGIGFLISYTFKYFTPFLKISFGYAVSLGLFFCGFKLEKKEKLSHFGRVLLGGGWAMVYFTTYAMHHFDASRIIQNQVVDLILLAIVVVGMMMHTLKYRSENMTSVALFIAYLTATMGQITNFTFFSYSLLAIVVLVLVYKLQWVKTLILGILLTFGIHYFWVMPNINSSVDRVAMLGMQAYQYPQLMNLGFLTSYWLVFFIGLHLIRVTSKSSIIERTLSAANLGNFFLYAITAYPLINRLFYGQIFMIVLSFGIIYLAAALLMKKAGREKLYSIDIIIAILAITISIPLKYSPTTTLLLWFVEIPFLLFIGFNHKQSIIRYLSYVLTVSVFLRGVYLLNFQQHLRFFLGNSVFSWHEFMTLSAGISMGLCCYIFQKAKKKSNSYSSEVYADHVFSGLSAICITTFIWLLTEKQWMTVSTSIESLILFIIGIVFSLKRLRLYCYGLLGVVVFRFILVDRYPIYEISSILKWVLLSIEILVFFVLYFYAKHVKEKCAVSVKEVELQLLFAGGNFLLMTAIFKYIPQIWITFSLSIQSLALFAATIILAQRKFRLYCYMLLGIVVFRFIFVEHYVMGGMLKWFMICMEIITFFGIYFYARYLKQKGQFVPIEDREMKILFGGGSLLMMASIFEYVPQIWITFGLSIQTLVVFFAGVILSELVFRRYCYVLLAIVAFRLVFIDQHITIGPILKWFMICTEVFLPFVLYFYGKYTDFLTSASSMKNKENQIIFGGGIILLVCAVFKYVQWQWISLVLGVAGVILIVLGMMGKDKASRFGGLILFALTLIRVVLVDLSQLDIIFKIISFIILGALFLGISYLYNRYNIGADKRK